MEGHEAEENTEARLTFGEKPIITFRQTTKKIINNITIEPLLAVHSFAYGLVCIIIPSLYFDKICRAGSPIFGNWNNTHEDHTWNDSICSELDNGEHDEEQLYVQETYANINLTVMFIKGMPPVIFALFIGPWSDKYGRKLLMILPMTGYVFFYLWMFINVIYYDEMVVEYLMLEVFAYWPGGWMCMFMGFYSYISDISTPRTRAIRIGILDCTFSLVFTIALAISGPIKSLYGYPALFGTSAVVEVLGIFYGIFFIKESKEIKNKKNGEVNPAKNSADKEQPPRKNPLNRILKVLREIFNFKNVKESFEVAFKKRDGGIRHVVIVLILIFSMYMLVGMGIGVVSYPYTREMFEWESSDYFVTWWSTYSSVTTAINFLSYFSLPIMVKVFHWHELTIATLCLISNLLYCIAVLLATSPEFLYVAAILNILAMMTTTPIRASLSKIVGPDDVGKVFACVAATTAMVDFVAPLYNLLYKYTLEWHPGFSYCLSALFLIILITMTMYSRWFTVKWENHMEKKAMSNNGSNTNNMDPNIPCAPRFRSFNKEFVYNPQ